MPPVWTSEWVGTPYRKLGRDHGGFDCFGLYLALNLDRLDRVIPDPYFTPAAARRDRPWDSALEMGYAAVESDPVEGDAILISYKGFPLHVAYCINQRYMIHCRQDFDTTVEQWSTGRWRNKVLGVFRYGG